MSWTADLQRGVAQLLAGAGIGLTFREGTVYLPGEVPIGLGRIPLDAGLGCAVTPYPVSDHVERPESVVGMQVRARSGDDSEAGANGICDDVFDLLQGMTYTTVGGVIVVDCYRFSAVPMGADARGRPERADNYYLTCQRPTAHRSINGGNPA